MRTRRSKRGLVAGGALAVLAAAGIWWAWQAARPAPAEEPVATEAQTRISARAGDRYLELYQQGGWQEQLLKGVALGASKPGHLPGEQAVTQEEYARWLAAIGDMNANVIQVSGKQPAALYEAMAAYNKQAKQPLYVLQGIAFSPAGGKSGEGGDLQERYEAEIARTIDALHGDDGADTAASDAAVSNEADKAGSGADVSAYVLGLVLELPELEQSRAAAPASEANTGFSGRYFDVRDDAGAAEVWAARMLDYAVDYEQRRYAWQRPVGILTAMRGELEEESSAVVDAGAILPRAALKGGYFAAVELFPSHSGLPETEPGGEADVFVDHRGEPNRFAGYLRNLRERYAMPVVISGFGASAARGVSARDGTIAGYLSEAEQGDYNAARFEDIYEQGMAGGAVFAWQDSWYATAGAQGLPPREPGAAATADTSRAMWSDAQDSAQHYGLLGFEPGAAAQRITVDGAANEWDNEREIVSLLADDKEQGEPAADAEQGQGDDESAAAVPQTDESAQQQPGQLARLAVVSDARGLAVLLEGAGENRWDWERTHAMILIDTGSGTGTSELPVDGAYPGAGVFDYIVDLKGPAHSRLWTASSDGYERLVVEAGGASLETGRLRFGNADPEQPYYDSLTDAAESADRALLELRIPWGLLGIQSPQEPGPEGLRIAALTYAALGSESGLPPDAPGQGAVLDMLPRAGLQAPGPSLDELLHETWEGWDMPDYEERLKVSYSRMKEAYGRLYPPLAPLNYATGGHTTK
ncbi:hypothetical protein IDH44_21370 [Paenibacillus sp. IB182496]|uniref:Uncharacterized protein n=1 Tax=Paenibacillus sabuli TaxID=2772509 RepID=A0A927BVS4_9BACL|nr:hypothetical protein [Paenibacillus sabuli]MBD2847751.1 hypothetical protein [Paenibacillus sabuli]